ncbi:MAG: GyrI-like domain-containing protein [Candidatus Methanosuratincola sp.]|jgi:effector-binding domain-containing protein|nr:GyrI-like domain-containing protein [Candidatus Methanosuratincola sp.]
MVIGFPTAAAVEVEGDIGPTFLPSGKAVTGFHVGPYCRIGETYKRMMDWMADRKLRPAGKMWEIYLTDPEKEKDPEGFVTQIFWTVEE